MDVPPAPREHAPGSGALAGTAQRPVTRAHRNRRGDLYRVQPEPPAGRAGLTITSCPDWTPSGIANALAARSVRGGRAAPRPARTKRPAGLMRQVVLRLRSRQLGERAAVGWCRRPSSPGLETGPRAGAHGHGRPRPTSPGPRTRDHLGLRKPKSHGRAIRVGPTGHENPHARNPRRAARTWMSTIVLAHRGLVDVPQPQHIRRGRTRP